MSRGEAFTKDAALIGQYVRRCGDTGKFGGPA